MSKRSRPGPLFEEVRSGAAGCDVGQRLHWFCVGPDPHADVREFGATTPELEAAADWLIERGVSSVALEATGVYWIPLFEVLSERGLEAVLVHPRQTHRGSRPKTDVLDCQWIRRLHAAKLLSASFVPDDVIRPLRSFLRRRSTLAADAGRYVQQMQKAMELANCKLSAVCAASTCSP